MKHALIFIFIFIFIFSMFVVACANTNPNNRQSEPDAVSEAFHRPTQVSENLLRAIKNNAELVKAQFSKQAGFEIGYTKESVEWIDQYILKNRHLASDKLIKLFGAYLGEFTIHKRGGSWVNIEGGAAIRVDETHLLFPFSVVTTQFHLQRCECCLTESVIESFNRINW
jgi:hypothetical protein